MAKYNFDLRFSYKCIILNWSTFLLNKPTVKSIIQLYNLHQYKAFRHVETLLVRGRNLVASRPTIGWRGLFTFHQLIACLLGTKFLPGTNKVSTCRNALFITDSINFGKEYLPN